MLLLLTWPLLAPMRYFSNFSLLFFLLAFVLFFIVFVVLSVVTALGWVDLHDWDLLDRYESCC